MDRRSQQNHIRAARDWLGKAEDSLARENDVQGDLKLMLARAELAHVGQSRRSRILSLWGRRGAALLVAFALAAGICWQEGPVAIRGEEASPRAEQPAVAANPIPSTTEKKADTVVIETAPVDTAQGREKKASPAVQPPAQQEKAQAPKQAETSPATKAAPQPPNVEKQQLMQSAGKILRQ